MNRALAIALIVCAAAALCACSSSSTPTPPLNDAGHDTGHADTGQSSPDSGMADSTVPQDSTIPQDSAAGDTATADTATADTAMGDTGTVMDTGMVLGDSGTVVESGTDGGTDSGTVVDTGTDTGTCMEAGAPLPPSDAGPPACSSLPGTIVYIESGDTQEQLLKVLGRKLRDDANITIVFTLTGSCTLAPALYAGTPIPMNMNMLYIPSTAESPSWTPTSPELACTMSAATPPNLGIAALFPSSCAGLGAAPAGIGSFIGPIQAYTFIVPTAEFTTQTAITAAEAYYAIGDGVNNPVTFNGAPEWNVPTEFYLRPATKSTLVATAFNIDLTAKEATLVGADGGTTDGRHLEQTSTNVLTAVAASTSMQALGILGDEVFDANRGGGINVLAFAGFGQSAAYYPDSTTTAFDKQNIRDGHYSLWSPTVYITPVDNSGVPTSPQVKYITDLVLGNPGATPPGGLVCGAAPIDGLGSIVSVGLTPSCAMQVQRASDGAPLTPSSPPAPCTCYFLSKVPSPAPLPASCVSCSAAQPCASGACFNGYCEVSSPAGVAATAITKSGLVLPVTPDGGLAMLNP